MQSKVKPEPIAERAKDESPPAPKKPMIELTEWCIKKLYGGADRIIPLPRALPAPLGTSTIRRAPQ